MRVIAGTYRSRLLTSPPGTATRPTSDRLRETLFNILAPRLEGCRFADLYAGTGAVGIEAISRGAEFVWFAEKAEPALKALRANLAALKIVQGFAVEERGTGALLQRLAKLSGQVDVVFLDPPYEAEAEYAGTLAFLGSATGRAMLADGAVVLAEHATVRGQDKFKLAERYGALVRTREYNQGDASVSFYAVDRLNAGRRDKTDKS
jgi:16S rRNA (guanine(966)-N(2))-methyltransferase RsmD